MTTIATRWQSERGTSCPMARQLLRRSLLELDAAQDSSDPQLQFLHAHMAAIRAASAVLALGAPKPRRRGRVLSVWEQLAEAGERWESWAVLFAAAAPVRAAIESGRVTDLELASAREALAVAGEFYDEVGAAVLRASQRGVVETLAS